MEFLKEIIITTLSGVILALFIYKTYEIYAKRRRYKHIPGPPADGILDFYLGNLRDIYSADAKNVMLMDLINEWLMDLSKSCKWDCWTV